MESLSQPQGVPRHRGVWFVPIYELLPDDEVGTVPAESNVPVDQNGVPRYPDVHFRPLVEFEEGEK